MKEALFNKPVVTIYGAPRFDSMESETLTSNIQDEGLYGMPVTIIGESSHNWAKIKTHYHYEGYVPIQDLWFLSREQKEKRNPATLRFVLQAYADVLAIPKVQGIRLLTLTRGAIVSVINKTGDTGDWTEIRLNNGQEGYIKSAFLGTYYEKPSSQNENELREKIVASAKTYLGTQYRWGGKSTLGIDCSGLCSMAYLLNGIKIYRDAKIKKGFPIRQIDFKNKKPGDLIFYPGHVTLYLGEDQYIHSTAQGGSDGVVINSLSPHDQGYRRDLAENISVIGSIFK